MGPAGAALVLAVGAGVFGGALLKSPVWARVLVASIAFILGAGAGYFAWFLDRYPGVAELERAVVAVGIPPGFTEDRELRAGQNNFPFGETFHTRSFRGTGTPEALIAQMIDRLRRTCYSDAAVRPPGGPGFVVVAGVCRDLDVDMIVTIQSQEPGLLLVLTALPRESATAPAPVAHPRRAWFAVSTRQ